MHRRTRPTFSVVTSSASSSSRTCFFIPVSDMAKGSASSLMVALPPPSRSSTARRVGSARAAKARSTVVRDRTIRFTIATLSVGAREPGQLTECSIGFRQVQGRKGSRLPTNELGGREMGVRRFVPGRRVVPVLVVAAGLAFLFSSAFGTGAQAGSGITFGHAVVVDHQRVTGEPSLTVSPTLNTAGSHDIYVSAPWGFSTTTSYVWKSEDGGQTFHLVGDEAPPEGKPAMTCAGGGDSRIVNDHRGNLYFADLQGRTDVSDSVSVDVGNSFVSTCNSANDTGVDRPWLATYGDPLSTGREYMTVDEIAQC